MSINNKLNEKEWNKLLNKIDNGEVVLLLGNELSAITINGQRHLLKEYILRQLVMALNDSEQDSSKHLKEEDIQSFSDISYDYKRREWQTIKSDPYMETTDILSNISKSSYDTEVLQKLFSINKFKIVLTTGFDNIACSVLEDMYGPENIEHLSYKRGSNGPDLMPQSDKILFYQLFGKASSDMHSFVLSEDDLLDFIHFWMDQNYRPKVLSNVLRDKYILVLGCNYPNWLFRFFFHSLKYSSTMRKEGHDNGLLADTNLDPELVSFLRRMETSVYEDAINFINELHDRWEKRAMGKTIDNNNIPVNPDEDDFDAFISYASEDFEEVREIARIFNEKGLHVWFDKNNLESGDKYEIKIKNLIEQAKFFIPVLSPNTEKNSGARFFRKEWKWASDADESHFGTDNNYIRPVLINGFIMTNKHVFKDRHCVDLSVREERANNIRQMIRNIRK